MRFLCTWFAEAVIPTSGRTIEQPRDLVALKALKASLQRHVGQPLAPVLPLIALIMRGRTGARIVVGDDDHCCWR